MSAAEAPHLADQGGDAGYFSNETEETHALAGMSGNTTGVVVADGKVVRAGVETDPSTSEPDPDAPLSNPDPDDDGLTGLTNDVLKARVAEQGREGHLPDGVKLARANKDQLVAALRA